MPRDSALRFRAWGTPFRRETNTSPKCSSTTTKASRSRTLMGRRPIAGSSTYHSAHFRTVLAIVDESFENRSGFSHRLRDWLCQT
jgi:hypothetical protein